MRWSSRPMTIESPAALAHSGKIPALAALAHQHAQPPPGYSHGAHKEIRQPHQPACPYSGVDHGWMRAADPAAIGDLLAAPERARSPFLARKPSAPRRSLARQGTRNVPPAKCAQWNLMWPRPAK